MEPDFDPAEWFCAAVDQAGKNLVLLGMSAMDSSPQTHVFRMLHVPTGIKFEVTVTEVRP